MTVRNGEPTVTALGVRIGAVEGDISEIKDSLLGLDAKIDRATADLAREVRAAIAGLSTQLAERQRTPWGVIFTGAAVIISVLGLFGSQALSPLQSDIKRLEAQIVPRVEHDYRQAVTEHRFENVEGSIVQMRKDYLPRIEHDYLTQLMNQKFAQVDGEISKMEQRRYDEQHKIMDDLREKLRALERPGVGWPH